MLWLFLVADVLQRSVQMVLLKKIIGFDSLRYIREAYVPPIIIAVIMAGFMCGYSFLCIDTIVFRIVGVVFTLAVTAVLIYFIGLTKGEKVKVVNYLRKRKGRCLISIEM